MNFIVFEGALGSGKTNGAVTFAHYLKAKNNKIKLYANFTMKDAEPFTSLYQLEEIAKNYSTVVVLDEAHVDLDARSSNSNHVKFISQAAFYLRKLRCTFIMTSPLYLNLDTRIRGVTNMLAYVSKDKRYFYYDLYDIQSQKYLKSKKIRQELSYALNLYDTNSIVSPIEVPETKKDFDKFLKNLKEITENYYHSNELAMQA